MCGEGNWCALASTQRKERPQGTKRVKTSSRLADDAQERLVLAFAEVLDAPVWSSGTGDAWEKEFKPGAEGYNGIHSDL